MKCSNSEIEIETLVSRIRNKDINLQPDFQRGEIWPVQKKKKLIDSIFRGWKVPPIHVIENQNFVDEVLDGQQRLASIRDFIDNRISIDGTILPEDETIQSLDNLYFKDLNPDFQRKFRKYCLTIIRLTEYNPDEPAELFNRLNQPSSLTSAEKRNAYSGKTRNQIRDLVNYFENIGAEKGTIGFSNSRMAYDEILSKFCFTLEVNTLRKKITSNDLTDKYRLDEGFSREILDRTKGVLDYLINLTKNNSYIVSLNKATSYSWLLFIIRNMNCYDFYQIQKVFLSFEELRFNLKKQSIGQSLLFESYDLGNRYAFYQPMILLFNQKSSMGSTDASAVIMRDIILEIHKLCILESTNKKLLFFLDVYKTNKNISFALESFEKEFAWGTTIDERC